MKEKIRLLMEGNRLVLIIEDTSPEEVEKVKRIIGDVMLERVEGIIPNKPRDISIPQPDVQSRHNAVIPAAKKANEYSPIVFSTGRYAGKTLADAMNEAGYVLWLARNEHNEFRWSDFYYFLGIWHRNCKNAPYKDICAMIKTLDLRPNAQSIQSEITNALGIADIEDVKNPNDEEFVRELLLGIFEKMKKK